MISRKNYKYKLTESRFNELTHINFYNDKNLEVKQIENAYVLPPKPFYNPFKTLRGAGGVLSSTFEYIELSAQKASHMSNRIYGAYDISKIEVPFINETVFYLNYFIKQWGHFLIDVIGRLWYYIENSESLGAIKIVYTVDQDSDEVLDGNYLELLKLIGLNEKNLLKVNQPIQFKSVIIPEMSILPGEYYTNKYKLIFDTVINNIGITEKTNKNIYCSRMQLTSAKNTEIGEKWIQSYFEMNNFESKNFQNMSVVEQIKCLNSASKIVMLSGSLQHNLLFVRNPVDVYILTKFSSDMRHEHMVNSITSANISYIDIYLTPFPIMTFGPFWYTITDEFIHFSKDVKLKTECLKSFKIHLFKEFIIYMYKYIKINWKFILKGIIRSECEWTNKELRKQFRYTIKKARLAINGLRNL